MNENEKTEKPTHTFFTFDEMELPALSFEPKSIFVAPLNWGLGHATRSADVVLRLKKQYPEASIILGSDGVAACWLRQRFPELRLIELPGYRIRYPRNDAFMMAMLRSAPALLRAIIKEHHALRRIIREHSIDLVISDNRFGLWSRHCTTVIITHQLRLLPPKRRDTLLMSIVNRLNRWFISRHDRCWVPDFAEFPGLAGILSHPEKPYPNVDYIGPLSRFRWVEPDFEIRQPPELLCIVSGPEPQREIFLNLLLEQLKEMETSAVVVAGTPGKSADTELPAHIKLYPNLPDEELLALMKTCRLVISRSGYSTIMDAYFAECRTAFVPTPGQSEQEYLAQLFRQRGLAICQSQSEMDIREFVVCSL